MLDGNDTNAKKNSPKALSKTKNSLLQTSKTSVRHMAMIVPNHQPRQNELDLLASQTVMVLSHLLHRCLPNAVNLSQFYLAERSIEESIWQ